MRIRSIATVCAVAAWAAAPTWANEAVEGADAGGLGAQLIRPQVGTLVWTIVTFVLMAVVLGRYAWKPLLGALDAREKGLRDAQDQARRDREEAETLLREHRELVAAARRERAETFDRARREAERLKEEMLDQARKQQAQLAVQAEEQIQARVRQARAELKTSVADLALQAAEKLLSRSLDDATHRQLVEEHLAELERRPGGARPS
jgi:F-type H+-transporting ATPase subunit b